MKLRKILFLCSHLLSGLLTAQQITYTSLPNLKDTFDYASYSFLYQGNTYVHRSRYPEYIFFSHLDKYGIPQKDYFYTPKLAYTKFAFYSQQIGSKLFQLGAEEDTIDRRGNILILNPDFSVFKDSIFYAYANMEFNKCRYDTKRNKVISLFSYSTHKDSLDIRRWGIMELDTLGSVKNKKEITPIAHFEYADNLLVTSDGNYLVSGKLNGKTTDITPFFVKLDTNFNILWRTDLSATGEKFFTQYITENLVELPNNRGYTYLGSMHRNIDTITRKCWNYDHFNTLHFISLSGQITKNYYHNLSNPFCELAIPKGLFLKNDSVLMVFTQRYHDLDYNGTTLRTPVSLVIHYNFNQHKVVKEILGGFLLLDKTNLCTAGCTIFRTHVGKDIDGGYLTSGYAFINDNNGASAYLMKTDSCGYTQDHKCKLVYKIDTLYGNTLKVHIIDSLSVLCQPIWTIEGKQYTSLDITHQFTTLGTHTIKLWGFAGSTTDSLNFHVRVDSFNSSIIHNTTQEISIYPNPATSFIVIAVGAIADTRNLKIRLTNILGQEIPFDISSIAKNLITIDTKKLPQGIYLITITDKENKVLKQDKIIVQREY